MQTVEHQIITASAGTGKTHALTGRILRLLALGVPFDRIVALTFTRAAAGEMFDTLIGRLAAAAADPAAAAAETRRTAGLAGVGQDGFLSLLRHVTDRMHTGCIGTLDAFFVRVLQSFPFEFGVSGEFALLEGHALTVERQRALRAILRAPADRAEAASRSAFLEAFKRATFGAEEKRLHSLLESFVEEYHGVFAGPLGEAAWGEPGAIWGAGRRWWRELTDQECAAASRTLREGLEAGPSTPEQQRRWEAFLGDAAAFGPGSLLGKEAQDLFEKLLDARQALEHGSAQIVVGRRRCDLSPAMCRAALDLAGHVAACVIRSRVEATRGLRDILARYEAVYDATVRRSGRLAFADVTYLMTRGSLPGAGLEVAYRLDGRYDHWALDEFQDTSRAQWQAIEPLVAEVVQDPEGRRSFFAVGDVKQAVYGWRGGDSRLLGEIAARYGIGQVPLVESYRCGPAVIEAVNRVFSGLGACGLPEAVAARWGAVWETHRSARPGLPGVVELCEVRPTGDAARVGPDDCAAAAGAFLNEVEPWSRGLSTGVLVRSNAHGEAMTEGLRALGIPAVWAGDRAIADNPAVAAMLDLFRFAEHPGDSLAWHHLLMTPLRQCLGDAPEAARDRVALDVLGSLRENGFAATVEQWLARLRAAVPLDPFSRQRLRALLDAAEAFDRTGMRSCLDFVDFVKDYTAADVAAPGTVHVMTLHGSKGLGFDLVVLPLLAGHSALGSVRAEGLLAEPCAAGAAPRWLLLAPPTRVALSDPVLAEAAAQASADAAFGEVCLLYVGMTRARSALRVLVPPPPRADTGSIHLHTVVRRLLADADAPAAGGLLGRIGDPEWFRRYPVQAAPSAQPAPAEPGELRQRVRAGGRRAVAPSLADLPQGAGDLFSAAARRGQTFGRALHGFLERVRWLGEEPAARTAALWHPAPGIPPELEDAVAAEAERVLRVPEIRRLFARPEEPCELWRERSFEVLLDGAWVSGTFDRVLLRCGADGRPRQADLVDFKTDTVSDQPGELERAVARHRPQMTLYRRALCLLTGLPPEAVHAYLVFVVPGCVCRLDA